MRYPIAFLLFISVQPVVCAEWVRYDESTLAVKHYSTVPFTKPLQPSEADIEIESKPLPEDVNVLNLSADKTKLVVDKDRQKERDEPDSKDIPLDDFGAGAAGAIAVLAGKGWVIKATKKKENG